MPICTKVRTLVRLLSFSLLRISTVKDVVSAVSALPAAEYAAAIKPMINNIPTITGK